MGRIKVTPKAGASFTFSDFVDYLDSLIFDANITSKSATKFTTVYNDASGKIVSVVSGSGFTYANDPDSLGVKSGTFQSIVVKSGGSTLGTISNINIKAGALKSAVDAENNGNATAIEKFFLNKDWNYIGTNANDIATASTRVGDGYKFNPRGNDIFDLRGGNDRLFAGDGNDVVKGGNGNDIIWGGNGRDKLFGGAGSDTLKGGAANDVLRGDTGNDILFGQAGNDRFIFDDGFGKDKIVGFKPGQDVIDLRPYSGLTKFSDLTIVERNGNAVIDLGTDEITLGGVSKAALDADDFLI
ncbi:MAG: hypothetical protein C0606_07780 [Hyphomicrobiales bacterium]|nr:MAG: hypothetical protein C0606_07780 [Hyphomicrobiales bacterium]